MLETCTTKRMLLLIVALLVSSLIILLFEEYVEDSELAASRQLLQNGKLITPDVKAAKGPDSADCPQTETLNLLEECRPCSNFEINALQSAQCAETGYYNKFLCGANNRTFLTACYSKQMKSFVRFNLFCGVMLSWSGILYVFVSWRRKAIEARSYTRLQRFVG